METSQPSQPAARRIPGLPEGRYVDVPRRGTFFVREASGPPGAPTLILIHGWIATGGLNWFQVFEPLSRHFRVIAPDMRGHGRGLKSWRRFRLEDCADDVAAIMRKLGTGPALVAGYSMGGPISQLVWKRHSPLVSGLVQCATSDKLTPGRVERLALGTVSIAVAGTTRIGQIPAALPRWIARRVLPGELNELVEEPESTSKLALREIRGHNVRMLMEAGYAISQYDGSSFTRDIQVPTSVVLTLHDTAILEKSQMDMARRIRTSRIFPIADGHVACRDEAFGERMLDACLDVQSRVKARARGGEAARPPGLRSQRAPG